MKNGKWLWHIGEGDLWNDCAEGYETREEAIAAGIAARKDYGYDLDKALYVGQVREPDMKIDAFWVIDFLDEKLTEQCGEAADGWMDGITKAEQEQLDVMLNETMNNWFSQTNNHPACFSVENIELVEATNG